MLGAHAPQLKHACQHASAIWNAELKQLLPRTRKVTEEQRLVLGIRLDPLAEHRVGQQRQVGWQHHQLTALVLVLARPIPLLLLPLLFEQLHEKVVRERGRCIGPRPAVAAAIGVATAERMCANQRNGLAIGEAHSLEDAARVHVALRCVGKPAVGRTLGAIGHVGATRSPSQLGSAHGLDRHGSCQRPQIGIRNVGMLGLDLLQSLARMRKTVVGAMRRFRCKAHRSAVRAAITSAKVVGTRGVPCQANQNRAPAAVVPIRIVENRLDITSNRFVIGLALCERRCNQREPDADSESRCRSGISTPS
jgi:hypothetical protein